MNKIPKTIHQIWIGNKPIPEKALVYRKKIIELHPDWTHMLWTEDSLKRSNLIVNKTYYLSENTGHRSDILRYQILYEYGGIYLDMDMEMQRSLLPLLKLESFIGAIIPIRTDIIFQTIENAVLGSVPKNLFFGFLLSQLPLWYEDIKHRSTGAAVSTGPQFVNVMINRYKELFGIDPITILPHDYFYPYNWTEKNEKIDSRFPASFGIHRWWGTWTK